jgi:L-arabinose isomerase
MIEPVRNPRVALLGLTLDLYREAVPGYLDRLETQLAEFSEELAEFAAIEGCRLCHLQDQVVDEIKRAEQQGLDALLVVPMCYTASLMSALPLARTALPVVIWNTQKLLEITDDYDFDDLLMNHVPQGTQDVTNVLVRSGKRFGIESGHYQDRDALHALGEWLCAARAAQAARRMRVGVVGAPFQDMGDFGVDETRMAHAWGPYVVRLSLPRLVALAADVPDADVARSVEEDRAAYDVADDVTAEIHSTSSRLAIALRTLVEEGRLDAFTMNFLDILDDGRLPTLPFLGINKLLADGVGYAGEGNTTIAAHVAQMRQLCGAANFTEVFTADYPGNRLLMTHMQECNPALARCDREIRLVRKDFWAPGIGPYVGMHFTLEPGPVTISNITTDAKGDFHYVVCEGSVRDMAPLAELDIPHWMIELEQPVGDMLSRYSLAGGTHHLAASPGHCAARIRKLAHLQGFGFTQV